MLGSDPTRRPQTFGGAVFLGVLGVSVTCVVLSALGAWRLGVAGIGLALIVGAGFRLALPEWNAGMLRVRRRATDVALMVLVGAALIALAVVIPNRP